MLHHPHVCTYTHTHDLESKSDTEKLNSKCEDGLEIYCLMYFTYIFLFMLHKNNTCLNKSKRVFQQKSK